MVARPERVKGPDAPTCRVAGAEGVASSTRQPAHRGRTPARRSRAGTSQTVDFAFDAFSYDSDTGAPVLAAALGFRVFLFQVPYVCVFVIIAGFVADLTGTNVTSMFHGRGSRA